MSNLPSDKPRQLELPFDLPSNGGSFIRDFLGDSEPPLMHAKVLARLELLDFLEPDLSEDGSRDTPSSGDCDAPNQDT